MTLTEEIKILCGDLASVEMILRDVVADATANNDATIKPRYTDDEFYKDDPTYISGGVTARAIQIAVASRYPDPEVRQSGIRAVTMSISGEETARKRYTIQPEKIFPYFVTKPPQLPASAWYLVGVLEELIISRRICS